MLSWVFYTHRNPQIKGPMAFEGETVNKGLTQQEWGFILFVYRTETKKSNSLSSQQDIKAKQRLCSCKLQL